MGIKTSDNTFKIPEGKKLKDAKLYCSKHGECTDKSFFLSYIIPPEKEGELPLKRNFIYCKACICDLLEDLRNQGKIGTINAVPIFEDIEKEVKDNSDDN